MSDFHLLNIEGASHEVGPHGSDVLHVKTPHALVQAAGYLKHMAKPWERVLFRGQDSLYGSLRPGLYRGIKYQKAQSNRHTKINAIVDIFSKSSGIFCKIPIYAHEALLQHYGIQTTWLDIVDNVWVATWFAVHSAHSAGRHSKFLHFDERKPTGGDNFGYILLIKLDENRQLSPRKGMIVGTVTETVDLRIAVPSIFLRPHAQHGLLFRKIANRDHGRELDYSSTVQGIIRFDLQDGLDWLGQGSMHSIRSLFPPPYFDQGYRILLDFDIEDKDIGCIHHVGA